MTTNIKINTVSAAKSADRAGKFHGMKTKIRFNIRWNSCIEIEFSKGDMVGKKPFVLLHGSRPASPKTFLEASFADIYEAVLLDEYANGPFNKRSLSAAIHACYRACRKVLISVGGDNNGAGKDQCERISMCSMRSIY